MSFASFIRRRPRRGVHRLTAGLTAGLLTVAAGGVVTVVSAGPASAAASADTILYVTNLQANTVTAYDTVTNAVVATIPVGAAPFEVLANASGSTLYVADINSTSVSVINTATNTVTATIPIGPEAPLDMALNPSGTELYVVAEGPNSGVDVINTATNAITATIATPNSIPNDIVFSPNGALAYVENGFSSSITVINAVANTAVATIPIGSPPINLVGSDPTGVAFSANGATAYVAYTNPNAAPGAMAVINTATSRITATIGLGVSPGGVTLSPNGAVAYVAVAGGATISAVSTATNSIFANIPVGTGPEGLVQLPNSSNAYVTNENSSNVSVINTATNTNIATIGVGSDPSGPYLTPDGSTAYILNVGSDTVSAINTATNQVIATYGGFADPGSMAVVAPPVAVTGISPSSGPLAGGSTVTITGTGFSGASTVDFGTVAATGVNVVNSTTLTATVPASASAGTVDVTVSTPAGTSAATSADRYTYIAPPVVAGISPNSGSASGGNTVTISGSGFSAGSMVSFGAVPGANPTVVNSTTLTVIAPPGTDGTVNVTVANADGTSAISASDRYTYLSPPVVTAISPARGPDSGGTIVTVTGSGFTGTTAVDFGTVQAANVVVVSDTSLTAVVPPVASAGSVDVTVTNPLGTSATSGADQYSYVAGPVVTGVSPASGPLAGGTSVTVTGAGFTGASAVDFGAAPATSFTVNSDGSITAVAPAGSAGTVDVTVTTIGGTSVSSSADHYRYAAVPVVSGVSPASGTQAGGATVTVTGSGFTGASVVHVGSSVADFRVVNDTTITLTTPGDGSSTGVVDVTVTGPGGTSATGPADQYTYTSAVAVAGVSPSRGPASGGTAVTITGSGFQSGGTVTGVDFGTTPAVSYTVNGDGSITATASAGTGTVDVTVTVSFAAVSVTSATSAADQYTYVPAPAVTGVSPGSGPQSGGTTVTLTGSGFTGASSVLFGTVPAASFTVVSATSITAVAPAAASAAPVDVTVTTVGGTSATSASDQFTYVAAPTVIGVSPDAGPLSAGTVVMITGTNLTGATAVDFGGIPATGVSVTSPTSLTVAAPASAAGTVDVTVTTTGGTSATGPADQYTYLPAPTVTAVTPSAGPLAGGGTVTITGTNLDPSQGTTVDFGAIQATSVTINSATSITATVPAGVAGTVDITAHNPGGASATSAADQYTYVPAPAVTGVSPGSGPQSGGTTVTLTGSGFSGASSVLFGTVPAASFTVVSATSITAVAPADASTGSVDVTVTTVGGTSTTGPADQYTYTTGLVLSSSVNPSVYGQPVTVTANLIQGSSTGPAPTGTVTFSIDGTTEPPTALSGTSATLALPPALGVGTHTVTATYSGDANYPVQTATALTQTVTQAATSTMLASSANPSAVGQPDTFTATVDPLAPGTGTPTGTVTFTVDGIAQSPVAVASGSASLALENLAPGAHTVTAAYSGDTNYAASTSGTLTQAVNQVTATVILTSSADPSVTGQGVTVNVAVAPVAPADTVPTGTVTLAIDGTALPPAALVNGSAAVTLPALAVGAHSITATYSGDGTYASATAPALTQTVNPAPTTTTLASSVNPSAIGQAVTFTATVTAPAPGGGTPTGQVVFTVDGAAQAPVTLTGGQATLSLPALTAGAHTITAAYTASTGYATSTSAALTQTVLPATTTTLTSSINPTVSGQSTTLTAMITGAPGGTPTGTVTFTVDGVAQPPVTLAKAKASLRISLTAGTHTITATYSGSSTLASSTSAPLTQTVNQSATTVTLTSSANPAAPGQTVAFTAVVLPTTPGTGTPTGTVTFTVDGIAQPPLTLNGGKAITFKSTTLTPGTHTLTAAYSGDPDYSASTSNPLTETITTTTDTTIQLIARHEVLRD